MRALPVLYCALHHAHTPESEHELMDGLHPKVLLFFSKHTFVIYWSFLIIVHIVVDLQNIDTDMFLMVSFYILSASVSPNHIAN